MAYEKWENPALIGENALPGHYSFAYPQQISLNGSWQFACYPCPEQVPGDFRKKDYNASSWASIPVPSCWETKGYGKPYYYGAGFPPAVVTSKKKIPTIQHKLNFTGAYRRTVNVPADWQGQKVILRFGSVKSAFYCWVNGKYVGMGKGSMLPVEFDVTDFVEPGENLICAQVFNYSDATYLECQDMWYLSGIYRDVTLYTQPVSHICDVYAHAQLDSEYQNAALTVEITAANAQGKHVSVELCWQDSILVSGSATLENDQANITLSCQKVHLWSAEHPNLYKIHVTLDGEDTKIVEFGFRSIEIDREKAQLKLNGQPLKLRGMNYHAFTAEDGYYVPREVYDRDLQTMKRFNINAIRTSHYPQDDYFYTLCNRYGIYVMDECNLETHAVRSKGVPGDDPRWTPHAVDRMERMVLRDRSHPCVVIWSLGNESDIGSNHFRMKEAALALDKTRPIHYEGGKNLEVSDFLCDGYSSPEREQEFADGKDVQKKPSVLQMLLPLTMSLDSIKFEDYKHHPIVATEYNYCTGNSSSDTVAHMRIFESSDRWCGGFVWDYKDKALARGTENGRPVWTYGGDWGVRDQAGNLGCNGACDPEGKPHGVLYEIKKVFQPFDFTLEGEKITIFNRNSFTDASSYDWTWVLTKNGEEVESGTLELPIAPRQTTEISLPCTAAMDSPGAYYLQIQCALRRDTPWADAGHVIAYDQWLLCETKEDAQRAKAFIQQHGQKVLIKSGQTVYTVSLATGDVAQIETAGHKFLRSPLRPAFYRAVTDADLGFMGLAMGKAMKLDDWGKMTMSGLGKPASVQVAEDHVTVQHQWKGGTLRRTYRFGADGALEVDCTLLTGKSAPRRFGMQMEMNGEFDRFTWFGRGPHDSYWGRDESGLVGIYSAPVTEQDEYVRPQEHGNKREIRWLTLTDQEGYGLRVTAVDAPIAASAWPYSLDELYKATHVHELPADHKLTTLNIDAIQNGLGDCFVPCPQRYKLQPQTEYNYRFCISPCK